MRLHDAWHIRLEAEREAKIKSLEEEIARLRDALDEQTGRAAWHYECLTQCEERVIQRDAEIERLRLTDAEREAIQWAAGQARLFPEFDPICGHADALRGLLERFANS